jgi:tRNA modification GTPase
MDESGDNNQVMTLSRNLNDKVNILGSRDTIVAISTPPGASGIGIVRLSGPEAISISRKLFVTASKNGQPPPSHTLCYGHIIDPDTKIKVDEVLLSQMRAPRTFTREDMAEINCHGGIVPLSRVLELCLAGGARLAEPGEFTKRAYINGRIDLVQAEAVIDIIQAKTQAALQAAVNQLGGGVSQKITQLQQQLLNLLALVEAEIDFPEEELETGYQKTIETQLLDIDKELKRLIQTFSLGKILREGVTTVIFGRPNVGKSTLLNQLLQEERAIVTPVPGTTRDTIEESINIGGFPLCLIDTAGITQSQDLVEQHGIERSRRALERAELILLMLDGSQLLTEDDLAIIDIVRARERQIILIINKMDLKQHIKLAPALLSPADTVHVSAKLNQGLESLNAAIIRHLSGTRAPNPEGVLITNARHHQALVGTRRAVKQAIVAQQQNLSPEFVTLDLNEALNQLGEIVGQTTSFDLLERIFSQFCIGK